MTEHLNYVYVEKEPCERRQAEANRLLWDARGRAAYALKYLRERHGAIPRYVHDLWDEIPDTEGDDYTHEREQSLIARAASYDVVTEAADNARIRPVPDQAAGPGLRVEGDEAERYKSGRKYYYHVIADGGNNQGIGEQLGSCSSFQEAIYRAREWAAGAPWTLERCTAQEMKAYCNGSRDNVPYRQIAREQTS